MRQGNGTDLLGMNDPRSASIGVIYVSPTDDRKSVLAAILTQGKLSRQEIVIVLPNPNKSFQRPQDFDDLKSVRLRVQGEIIFIAPHGPGPAEFARQRQFPVYDSLEEYTQALRDGEIDDLPDEEPAPAPEKKWGLFGGRGKSAAAGAAAGAALGSAAANRPASQPLDRTLQGPRRFPAFNATPQPGNPAENQIPATPRLPSTPSANHGSSLDEDEDDALPPPPSEQQRSGGAAALGAGAGLAADHLGGPGRQPQQPSAIDDDDMEDLPPRRGATNPRANTPGQRSPRLSAPLAQNSNQNTNQGNADTGNGPGIIDLQPVNAPRTGGRITHNPLRPNEPPASTPNDLDEEDYEDYKDYTPPPTHGATGSKKRRTGSMASSAAGAGALAAGAAAGNASAGNQQGTGSGSTGHMAAQRPIPLGTGPTPANFPNRNQRSTRSNRGRIGGLIIGLILLLVLSLFLCSFFFPSTFNSTVVQPLSQIMPGSKNAGPAVQPAVTVKITPNSHVVQDSYVLQAVTGNPQANLGQISLRHLTASPAPQSRQVNATGHTQTTATQATGTITFFNFTAPPTPLTIKGNTIFTLSNGVQIATDTMANIPAGTLNGSLTPGQRTVRAHALAAGTAGNIAAQRINGSCCVANVIAENQNSFTGGQNPQDYVFVQKSDVDAVVTPLVNSLAQQAQTTFNKELKSNEKLVGTPQCSQNVDKNNAAIGDQGHNVNSTNVTVSATCTGMAYDQTGAQKVAQDRLQKKAAADLGSGYALSGDVTTHIVNVTPQGQSVALQVNAQETLAYQLSDAQKTALVNQLAGKKVAAAQAILNAQQGFKQATITTAGGNNATLPTDPNQIKLELEAVTGGSAGPGTTPSGGSTPLPVNGPNATATPSIGRGDIPTKALKG
ncbi:hypothetical protein [Dictyobacter arantiisoli]|uniref:Baseplate protein J-like domain-containing protein n=1 Tax=Dictyobacter arantiisoli TaxID=2014874 RepID=A0A5A5TBK8_9CHLR|nr:hypothetical protein [Dictyobacter arantiisoli]GCF08389.1 hypothetical protein KDI_19530 [Dictyobacter arantiisoli]